MITWPFRHTQFSHFQLVNKYSSALASYATMLEPAQRRQHNSDDSDVDLTRRESFAKWKTHAKCLCLDSIKAPFRSSEMFPWCTKLSSGCVLQFQNLRQKHQTPCSDKRWHELKVEAERASWTGNIKFNRRHDRVGRFSTRNYCMGTDKMNQIMKKIQLESINSYFSSFIPCFFPALGWALPHWFSDRYNGVNWRWWAWESLMKCK